MKKWMTVPEVAERFSCSRRYVYTLVQEGRLAVINLGGAVGARGIRISAESIQTLEQSARIEADDYDE